MPAWDTDKIQNARSTVVALSWAEAVLTGVVGVTIIALSIRESRYKRDGKPRQVVLVGENRV